LKEKMMNQYEVLLFDTAEGVTAVVPMMPGCKAPGATDAEAVSRVREMLRDTLRRVRRITVEVEVEPLTAEEEPLPFSDEELEDIAARGPDDPRYWETLEAVAERFNVSLDRKGYTLEKMLTDLPAAGEAAFRARYGDALADKYKAMLQENVTE
jgi:hypothetical protein